MSNNSNLTKAKNAKNDEFYTQLEDIEKELIHYTNHFKDKVVYCNCDDPEWSNFWNYFHLNFKNLGLKKLISTHYNPEGSSYIKIYTGGADDDVSVGIITPLNSDGDFRSEECIEVLKSCDIIVTNPPFSLFREYIIQLIEYDKQFLVIGNQNAITYQVLFPLLKDNKMWLGIERPQKFNTPDGCTKKILGLSRWFTNLKADMESKHLILTKKYNPEDYPKYDNYDAINVNKTKDIPYDYDGVMGVPITFFDKYNPEQFKIIGLAKRGGDPSLKSKVYTQEQYTNYGDLNAGPTLINENGNLYIIYPRILIRKK